jgi:hypothetical protein
VRSKVEVYIARAIQAFVKDGKTLIKILYFLSKFDYDSILFKVSLTYSQFINFIEI